MRRYVWMVAVLMMAAVLTAGCGAKNVYGRDDTAISVKAGEEFTIRLEENPTTGYSWTVDIGDEDVLALNKDGYVPDDKSGELAGSGGMRVLTFRALKSGETSIDMVYGRSWEPTPEDEHLQYKVTVS